VPSLFDDLVLVLDAMWRGLLDILRALEGES
jgi:hypothetical protein